MEPYIHPASLVDATFHSPDLLKFLGLAITPPIIGMYLLFHYLVKHVVDLVDFAAGNTSSVSPDSFRAFVGKVLHRAEANMSSVLVSLAYIDRARPYICIIPVEHTLERVCLGALILASKYINDVTMRNSHWALCTDIFGKEADLFSHVCNMLAILETWSSTPISPDSELSFKWEASSSFELEWVSPEWVDSFVIPSGQSLLFQDDARGPIERVSPLILTEPTEALLLGVSVWWDWTTIQTGQGGHLEEANLREVDDERTENYAGNHDT
ncbi:uncharacterized protein ARMOST_14167 [Armillaria ostoyae]|uniref:Cyclin N-terminal domain-containing protein n=1 Tax=Armillaria ostoyae TaxID=47428 RepID=A0A284RPV4_ARMOS|nr:uncharacterized protein ARMOST_14167 [Armillaria ostoyae]